MTISDICKKIGSLNLWLNSSWSNLSGLLHPHLSHLLDFDFIKHGSPRHSLPHLSFRSLGWHSKLLVLISPASQVLDLLGHSQALDLLHLLWGPGLAQHALGPSKRAILLGLEDLLLGELFSEHLHLS